MIVSSLIFIFTLTLVIWQPRGLDIGYSALLGAVLAVIFGVVQISDIGVVWDIVWDATFTFIALIIISLILDQAGFFNWAALHIARWGNGLGHVLFTLIIVLGAFISAIFANDGAALLLTPIVIAILHRLQFTASAIFAFIIATGFIADTASLPLIISNLVNIVSANYFDLSFTNYALVMVPVNLVSITASLLVLWFVFRKQIPVNYSIEKLDDPATVIIDKQVFKLAFPLLAALIIAYFVLAKWSLPFSLVAGCAALLLFVIAGRFGQQNTNAVISLNDILRGAPWQIVIFSLGMYLVVYGLGQSGLNQYGAKTLEWLSNYSEVTATVGTGFLAAIVASIMNNMPSTLVGALAIDQAQVPESIRELMIYANIIGNDLGPKLTPIGSLATLLWLHVLAGKGHKVSWGQYMKIGLLITPPVLLVTLLSLVIWMSFLSKI